MEVAMRKLSFLLCSLILVISTLLPACGGQETAPTPGVSLGTLVIRATDAPPANVSSIMVTVANVEVHKSGTPEDSWVQVVGEEKTFDLVSIQGAETFLGQKQIEAGQYTQLRLDVVEVIVVVEGKAIKAKLPGEKLKVVRTWEVDVDDVTILTLDFDADQFVVLTGGNEAQVRPVVKLEIFYGDRPLKAAPAVESPPSSDEKPPPGEGKPESEPEFPPPGETPPPSEPSTPPETPPPSEPTSPGTPPDDDWTIPSGSGTTYRAVHMGGNWGTTRDAVRDLPPEYFRYVRDLNANWVGISVALHVDGSMDSTVELKYSDVFIPTFTDDTLRELIRAFRRHGFNVYIHMAFESGAGGEHPVQRWQLGDPMAADEDPNISPEYWPWRVNHPDHQQFVAEFWQTYTDALVHVAQIAEAEGVGLFTLGTETDRLFRSRSGGTRWPNEFKDEMKDMVTAVRAVYGGLLSYEMHWGSLVNRDYFGPGSDYLYDDLGLDVIAVSAYFKLSEVRPTQVLGVADLEASWEQIFQQHLIPLQQRNSGKSIVFTEFGYVDSIESPNEPTAGEFSDKMFKDKDGNGKDDGEETQANCYQAFFNVMEAHPGVVIGAFLWGLQMATEQQYAQSFAQMRTFNIRGKVAEEIVRDCYAEWR